MAYEGREGWINIHKQHTGKMRRSLETQGERESHQRDLLHNKLSSQARIAMSFPIYTKYHPVLNSFWIHHSRALQGGNCFGWSSAGAGGIHQLQVILLLLASQQFLDFSQFVFSGEQGMGREQTSPWWCLTASQVSRLALPSWQL